VRRALAFAGAAVLAAATAACHRAPMCGAGPRVALVGPTAPVGFDAPFAVEARPLCPEARAGTITWRPLAGLDASALSLADGGLTARASTPMLAAALGASPPWGVVPLSPRTRGEIVLEATWRSGGEEERHQISVVAAPRARGLPNTPLGARVYLGGAGWRVEARPVGATAALDVAGGATSLAPDVAGDWRLADGAGRALTLRAGRYDETPLDCGRAECHPSVAAASAGSPMTTVLARGLPPAGDGHGAAFGAGYPGCALACHATGEPGLADGGFADVMGALGIDVAALGPRRWESLPRPLRRLGGVGCLACHGPGALPEASARWSILRADVCATCHDAPARYGHVQAWRATRMARADRDPRAATERACARCHTTWGFLSGAAVEGATPASVDRRPPAEVAAGVGPMGVACAACHAVHEHGAHAHANGVALLRTVPRPALLAGAPLPAPAEKSAVCLACHTPDAADGAPPASAAALWLGRGGLDPATGAALNGPAPHAALAGGCVGCHQSGPGAAGEAGAAVEHGAGHAFVAGTGACARCHGKALPADDLTTRARGLWSAWLARAGEAPSGERPPHASAARLDRATPLGRAAWDVALVLEDPAAAAHNAPYARQLLAAAERAFNDKGVPRDPGGRE
jgi:hypothetical protein